MGKLPALLLIAAGTVAGLALYVLSLLWMLVVGRTVAETVEPPPPIDPDWRGRGNCWWAAVWRFCRHGGVLVIRPSAFIPTWHCMWAAKYGEQLYEFHPTPIRRGWRGYLDAPFHKGRWRRARAELRPGEVQAMKPKTLIGE